MNLKILPDNIVWKFDPPAELRDILDRAGLALMYPCGGYSTCGKCVVQFLKSAPEPSYADTVYFSEQKLRKGFRLACTCRLTEPATIRIQQQNRAGTISVLTKGASRRLNLDPLVFKRSFVPHAADLDRLYSDEELLLDQIGKNLSLDLGLVRKLPALLRHPVTQITATISGKTLLDAEPGDTQGCLYGCAVDLGTTTIVIGLYNLADGRTIGIKAQLNPQIVFGEDLISRISFINDQDKNLDLLQSKVIDCINECIDGLCRKNQITKNSIYELVLAGNAVQNHIFCGVNPYTISIAPYTPVFKRLPVLCAAELGLQINPVAAVLVLPNMGGFVGGDICADMLIAGFYRRRDGTHLLLDIGTNCEVVLQHQNRILAASSPAGPALEGARISCGMRAESGAIYDLSSRDGKIVIKTIDDKPACGICGSGLFHIIAEGRQRGWITADGRLKEEIVLADQTRASDKILLNQADVREFQLAKAAIAAAWQTLCSEMELEEKQIDRVYIAGAFGNFIRPEIALQLGLVPQIGLSKIRFIGNASLAGARMALLNKRYLHETTRFSHRTKFIELAGRPDFQDKYIDNMNLTYREIGK